MPAPPSNEILIRILDEKNIDLRRAPVGQRLSVYKLALQEIFEILKTDLRRIKLSSIDLVQRSLNSIRTGLLDLRTQHLSNDISEFIARVNPSINEALGSSLSALRILNIEGQTSEYYNILITLTDKINDILIIFESFHISTEINNVGPQSIDDEINLILTGKSKQHTSPPTDESSRLNTIGITSSLIDTQLNPDSSSIVSSTEQEEGKADKENEQVEIAIRALADNPCEVDLLEFSDYAKALVDFIENENSEKPLTIVIDAPWGMGKSTLMGLMKSELVTRARANKQRPFPIVWFNAWKYDQESSLWAALALEILDQVRKQFNMWRRFIFEANLTKKRLNTNMLFSAFFNTVPYFIGFLLIVGILFIAERIWLGSAFLDTIQKYFTSIGLLGFITIAYAYVKNIYSKVKPLDQKISKYIHAPSYYIRAPNYRERIGFLAEFEDDFKLVVASVTNDGRRPLVIYSSMILTVARHQNRLRLLRLLIFYSIRSSAFLLLVWTRRQ